MDLERLGDGRAATELVTRYGEFSGHPLPDALIHHYIAYRALVRAKVSTVRGVQQLDADRAAAPATFDLAHRLVQLCIEHLRQGEVRLVLVGGLPATGKSTLAEAIGRRRGWPVLRSDVVRKQRAGLDPTTPAAAGYGAGLYEASATEAVYDELRREAGVLLRMGESVVVDASWTSAFQRARARELAADTAARIVELRCEVAPTIATSRLQARTLRGGDASDATVAIAEQMRLDEDRWPEATAVETVRPADELARELDAVIGTPPVGAGS
jgi:predicted kinase